MFTGEYNCTFDEKNRVAIPSAMRKKIDITVEVDILYMTIGMDQCLALYPRNQFEELVNNRIKQLPLANKKARDFQRLFFSNARTIDKWDKQGRIVIPQKLKDYAGIDKEISIIGIMNRIEIWDKKKWETLSAENADKFEEIAEDISSIF